MSRKTISLVLMTAGGVLFVLSLAADWIGIGSYPGINSAQLAGIALGLAGIIYGYWLGRSRVEEKK